MQYKFKGEPNLTVNTYLKVGKRKRLTFLFTFDANGEYLVEEGQFSPDTMNRLISTFSHETLAEEAPKPRRTRKPKAKKEIKDVK